MATYLVTDTATGQKYRLTGDSPPTEAELIEIFAGQSAPAETTPPAAEPSLMDNIKGGAEAALTMVSGMAAEPLAGVAGLIQSVNPFAGKGAGADAVAATREALTYQPRTEQGQQALSAVGGALEPVADALTSSEDYLGNKALEITGSPALAAAAATMPTAIMEVLGIAGAKGVTRTGRGVDKIVDKAIIESAPSIQQLRGASQAIFKEISESGAGINPTAFTRMADEVAEAMNNSGLTKAGTPAAHAAIKEVRKVQAATPTLADLERLREVAGAAAASLNKKESMLGITLIDSIDEFLDDPANFRMSSGNAIAQQVVGESPLGARYKAARDLWGRAKRGEVVESAFTIAKENRAGMDAGLRAEFGKILRNKKQRRFFSDDEMAAMREVVQGKSILEPFGKLANATSLRGMMGIGLGGYLGGIGGSVVVPIIGAVSAKLASRLVTNKAVFADAVIRAGRDGRKIAQAYLKETPPNLRSADELSQLLASPDIDVSRIKGILLAEEAATKAAATRKALTSAAIAGAAPSQLDMRQSVSP